MPWKSLVLFGLVSFPAFGQLLEFGPDDSFQTDSMLLVEIPQDELNETLENLPSFEEELEDTARNYSIRSGMRYSGLGGFAGITIGAPISAMSGSPLAVLIITVSSMIGGAVFGAMISEDEEFEIKNLPNAYNVMAMEHFRSELALRGYRIDEFTNSNVFQFQWANEVASPEEIELLHLNLDEIAQAMLETPPDPEAYESGQRLLRSAGLDSEFHANLYRVQILKSLGFWKRQALVQEELQLLETEGSLSGMTSCKERISFLQSEAARLLPSPKSSEQRIETLNL